MERLQGGTGMKKKLVGVLLTAAMAVSALAGCGTCRKQGCRRKDRNRAGSDRRS